MRQSAPARGRRARDRRCVLAGGRERPVTFGGFRAVGYALDPDDALARALADAHESVHGARPRALRMASTTDARHYLNELALPALCYGPRVRNIHGVDEAVELASIVAGARTLTRFIPAFMT